MTEHKDLPRYKDKISADIALMRMYRKRKSQKSRSYSCWKCKGWHLTSAQSRNRGKR